MTDRDYTAQEVKYELDVLIQEAIEHGAAQSIVRSDPYPPTVEGDRDNEGHIILGLDSGQTVFVGLKMYPPIEQN